MGGDSLIVGIDEVKFGRVKHSKGRVIYGTWVFGGVESDNKSNYCLFSPVNNRTKDNLLKHIINDWSDWIFPGSTIINDTWRGYE